MTDRPTPVYHYDYQELEEFLRLWTGLPEVASALDRSVLDHIKVMAADSCPPDEDHCWVLWKLRDCLSDLDR